jgi:hypothetical protein
LGEFSDWPKPIAVPSACPKCEPFILAALDTLRKTHNTKILNSLPNCGCRKI